jgi:radical SAM superfamily enzyme YgiQ (UPF0313 family)
VVILQVTFIYPEISSEVNSKGSFHFGIGWLSACLKEAGHKISLLHLTSFLERKDFLSLLNQKDPKGILAFSSTTNDFPFVKSLAMWAKKEYDLPIICGGVHPTIDPETTICCDDIDMICLGEGEDALVELCNNMDEAKEINQIKNLWIKRNREIIRNPVRPLLESLDNLPYPDREIFNYEYLEEMSERRFTIMASRGCPYNCFYCCNYLIKGKYPNKKKYVRFRSVENVITEIEKGIKDYPGIERITFHDDILPLNEDWLGKFITVYKKKINLPFICNSRANLMNKEIVQKFKEAGCIQVGMGIESGNEDIRANVLNRKISREQIISAFKECSNVGLRTYAFNMVGLPLENNKALLETVKLNAQVRPSKIQTSIFYPYPFTRLYNLCIEKGYLNQGKIVNDYFKDTILQLDSMDREQIIFFRIYFTLLVRVYKAIFLLPGLFQKPLEKFLDKLLCSSFVPYRFLMTVRREFSPRTLLRSKFPYIYFHIRPYIKKLQYRKRGFR